MGTMSETPRGGKRPGAGRPSLHGERKRAASVRLTPTVWAFLEQQPDSAGETIEQAVRRTDAFRHWQRDN